MCVCMLLTSCPSYETTEKLFGWLNYSEGNQDAATLKHMICVFDHLPHITGFLQRPLWSGLAPLLPPKTSHDDDDDIFRLAASLCLPLLILRRLVSLSWQEALDRSPVGMTYRDKHSHIDADEVWRLDLLTLVSIQMYSPPLLHCGSGPERERGRALRRPPDVLMEKYTVCWSVRSRAQS